MKKKKIIGIIGGVGPQASHYLYGQMTNFAQSKYLARNNDDYPEIMIYSIPVPDFISNTSKIAEANKMFDRVLSLFERSDISYIGIACNTVHILLEEFKTRTNIKFVSMVEAVVDKVSDKNLSKVVVFSSPMTIKKRLYRNELEENNIEDIIIEDQDKILLESIIRSVLSGKNNLRLKRKYLLLIEKMIKQGVEGIILGCTELSLITDYTKFDIPVFDSSKILAEKLVDKYYTN
jgi:aspartate racemase